MKIIEEISKAQRTINVQKTEYNSFGKYKYRNAESILTAVKKNLPPEIVIIPEYTLSENEKRLSLIVNFYNTKDDTDKFSHKSEVFIDAHKGMSNEQCIGAAYSYCLKYALCAIFLIDNDADPDTLPPKMENRQPIHTDTQTAINNGLTETKDDKASRVYAKALNNLKGCNNVSEMLAKKAEMTAKMPDYKADINRAYDKAVQDLDSLNEENQAAANSHNDDDCPF